MWLDFPLERLGAVRKSQAAREAYRVTLEHVAEPTAAATGMVLSHGFRLAGRPDLVDAMARVGRRFGYLIYVLDAFEDFARDERTGDFNPLRNLREVDARAYILAAAAQLGYGLPH